MIVQVSHISIYLFLVFLCSIGLFCYGFFPLSFSPPTKSSLQDLPRSMDNVRLNPDSYKPRNSRVVLMVIDALRSDFVTQETNMPILNELIAKGAACTYQLQVHPPTVTMPRIKAITSGAIPSFLDVILNLGSPEMKLDTFLYQMIQQQQRIVFYGDNTWTSMFPNTFSRQGENLDSLYVNDFYEGDKNITENMRYEFNNYDWKMMILHFLGLDHIGHVEGPFSDKVPSKLREMDSIIEEIYSAMQRWNEKFYTKSLLVITGDHGMRDSGGHGGSSHPETHVPLVVVGKNCTNSGETFLQIDLAPTFATLMGVAIPHSSIGSHIGPVLSDIPGRDRLYAVHYNTMRLIEKTKIFFKDNFKEQDFFTMYKEAKLLHTMFLEHPDDSSILVKAMSKYTAASEKLSRLLIKHYIRYDMFSIVIGIFLATSVTILAVLVLLISYSTVRVQISFKLSTWIAVTFFGLLGKHVLQNYLSVESDLMAHHILILPILAVVFINWSLLAGLLPSVNRHSLANQGHRWTSWLLLLGSIFHPLSLASSSFIEEEHQTWYYLANTLYLMLTLLELRIMNRTIGQISTGNVNEVLLSHCRRERDEFCISAFLFFVGHTALRRWNQTGDKWQHIPDVGDWLGKDENKFWLSVALFFGLCYLLAAISKFSGFLIIILSMTACLLIYYYRLMMGAVTLLNITPSKNNNCLTIFLINLVEIFFIGFLPKVYRYFVGKSNASSSQMFASVLSIVSLVSALIHKPHNVLLVAAACFTSHYVAKRIDHITESKAENLFLKIVAHIWLGKMFYFYQGNSNNLATIDLNAGYVGLSSFNFVRVGLFLTLNTFNGQILSFLLLLYHLKRGCVSDKMNSSTVGKVERNKGIVRQSLLKILCLFIMGPLTFYIIIVAIMRNHIFVWTVFSPKIIYDCFYAGLTAIQLVAVHLVFG